MILRTVTEGHGAPQRTTENHREEFISVLCKFLILFFYFSYFYLHFAITKMPF